MAMTADENNYYLNPPKVCILDSSYIEVIIRAIEIKKESYIMPNVINIHETLLEAVTDAYNRCKNAADGMVVVNRQSRIEKRDSVKAYLDKIIDDDIDVLHITDLSRDFKGFLRRHQDLKS